MVDTPGSIEWLSFPRFDSPSVFGRLFGPEAGHWHRPDRRVAKPPPVPGHWLARWRSDARAKEAFECLAVTHRKEYARWVAEANRKETADVAFNRR